MTQIIDWEKETEDAILIRWEMPENCQKCFVKTTRGNFCYFGSYKFKDKRGIFCPLEKMRVRVE